MNNHIRPVSSSLRLLRVLPAFLVLARGVRAAAISLRTGDRWRRVVPTLFRRKRPLAAVLRIVVAAAIPLDYAWTFEIYYLFEHFIGIGCSIFGSSVIRKGNRIGCKLNKHRLNHRVMYLT